MFIPLHDKNPLDKIRFQYVTFLLIVVNVAVYVFFQSNWIYPNNIQASFGWGLVPGQLLTGNIFEAIPVSQFERISIPEVGTLFSYMFLHADVWHLIGNMAFLWVFGDNVEDATGHFRFLIFYILCGVAAGLAHSFIDPSSNAPLIGASGAVSGVIVAYLMLHPNIHLWVLVMWRFPVPVKAIYALSFWILLQFYYVYLQHTNPNFSNVAWIAHVGGVVAGAVLIIFLRRKGVPLFDMNHNAEQEQTGSDKTRSA